MFLFPNDVRSIQSQRDTALDGPWFLLLSVSILRAVQSYLGISSFLNIPGPEKIELALTAVSEVLDTAT